LALGSNYARWSSYACGSESKPGKALYTRGTVDAEDSGNSRWANYARWALEPSQTEYRLGVDQPGLAGRVIDKSRIEIVGILLTIDWTDRKSHVKSLEL
jgi:hypothetical protein